MIKKSSGGDCEPAQPLLPSINLARLLVTEPTWCGCDCEECPPFLHSSDDCSLVCRRMEVRCLQKRDPHTVIRG